MGAQARFYAFECTVEQAWHRVSRRNAEADGPPLHISRPTFDVLIGKVEALAPDEQFILVPSDSSNPPLQS